MVEPVERDSRGILRPAAGMEAFRLDRFAPDPAVARFIDRYWIVSWRLPEGSRYDSQVLAHPVVNVTFDGGPAEVSGVRTTRFSRVLEGSGRALGIMARPGGFHHFLGEPLSTITDRVLPLGRVPALAATESVIAPLVEGDAGVGEVAAALDGVLAPMIPEEEQPCETTVAWAALAVANRSLTRVEDLAAAVGVSVRTLQRAFTDHVGIGPKWFLRRYRLFEAAERVVRRDHVDWAALAAELGYADQAHLTRDFTAAIGQPPAQYAAEAEAMGARMAEVTATGGTSAEQPRFHWSPDGSGSTLTTDAVPFQGQEVQR